MINEKKCVIIGIGGPSGSGKTTFATKLKGSLRQYKLVLISMDSYFKPEEERHRRRIKDKEHRDDNHPDSFYYDRLISDIEEHLKNGKTQVIIVEGLFTLYYEELLNLLDLSLYMQCSVEERFARRLKRNMQYGQKFEDIANYYLQTVRISETEIIEPTVVNADIWINRDRKSVV